MLTVPCFGRIIHEIYKCGVMAMKIQLFSHLRERVLSSVWMTLFLALLLGIVYLFQGSQRIAYVILFGFVLGCLIEWGYACFISTTWKKYYIWPLGSVFILIGGMAFLESFNTKGWTSWIVIVASSIFTDTFAYLCGSLMKGPKIFPSVSAAKTYSGAIGGLALSCICTVTLGAFLHHPIGWGSAAALSVFAQLGDFLESWAKRHLEIKDSGNWIKGHGGVIDRTDSWWMTAIGYGIEPWI
ncbi:phosphatidate cytidylyltransferase [Holospora undulata]|nr:phosphatidate cytidylyltransferase [Holospora undulata]